MPSRRALLAAVLLLVALPARADDGLVVLAAASLTESLQKVAAAWTAKGNPRVIFSFDASSRLAKQVEAGAPADAFFSADTTWMDYVDTRGLVTGRADLVGNSLVAVVPAASMLPIKAPADLALPGVQHLALGGESVPAGKYGRAALTTLGALDAVRGRIVSGDNVRTVLSWVATGEAEAGVVYLTDARVEPRVKVAFTFPATSHPAIVYPMAVVKGAAHARQASEFLAYCRSPEGMAVFVAAGFSPVR